MRSEVTSSVCGSSVLGFSKPSASSGLMASCGWWMTACLLLKLPSMVHTPGFVLRAMLGEMAEALLLSGQRVLPQKAHWDGYAFRFPDLKPALDAALI